jgi:ElaB/YqjD/DUF883 family membrane-anchored ribosome-binding protein
MENIENTNSLSQPGSALDSTSQHGSSFNKIKTTIAEKLDAAADSLRVKADQAGGEKEFAAQYGRQAAGWLGSTAQYVRQFDVDRLKTDVENKVRKEPGRTLLIAGAVGLVIGALVRRR